MRRGTAYQERTAIVAHALWAIAHSADFGYTESAARAGWLSRRAPNELPQDTDCSGFSTECYYAAGAPDPNGLDYRMLGYTGNELENAAKHGRVFTDVSKAKPGDIVVIGPDTGEHEVVILEPGPDPIVATHGKPGVQRQDLSVDTRQPKRVCRARAGRPASQKLFP